MSPYGVLINTCIASLLVQNAASQPHTTTAVTTRIYATSLDPECPDDIVVSTVRLTEGNAYIVAYRNGAFMANNILRMSRDVAPEAIPLELVWCRDGEVEAEDDGPSSTPA